MKEVHKITILLLFLTFHLSGQSLEYYNRFNIAPYTSVSIDRGDYLFLAEATGSINKYDWDGNLLLVYSSGRITNVTNLDASMTNKIFVFYNDLQQYLILDRFLSPISNLHFPGDIVGFGQNATLAPDNNIWIIDGNDFSLKKFSPQYSNNISITSFDLLLNIEKYYIEDIIEYQNRLYIADKYSGILVFDNLGNYLNTIPVEGLKKISFYRNNLFISNSNSIKFLNIYNSEISQINPINLSDWEQVACGDEYMYFLKDRKVYVF